MNYLIIGALERFGRRYGDGLTLEFPRGSGAARTLHEITVELAERLVRIFLDDGDGHRPVFGADARFERATGRGDALLFHEYFDGDSGAGLGASHQTGWTGLVADMIIRLSRARAAS